MKIIEKLVVSPTAPKNNNVAWVKKRGNKQNELLIHDNNSWIPIGGSNSGGGSGSGIDIVDSVDKLDPNAEAGQVAVVAVQGTGKECGFGELYQNSQESIDMNTGTIDTSKCDRVTSISIKEGVILPSDFGGGVVLSLANPDLMSESGSVIMISASNSSIAAIIMTGGSTNFVQVYDGQTANTESVTMINDLLASDEFYYAIDAGLIEAGKATDFTILDTILQAQAGTSSTAEVFLKKDKWEKLYESDLNRVLNKIDATTNALSNKADIISVTSTSISSGTLDPNTYYKINCGAYSNLNYRLGQSIDPSVYSEYIIQLTCTGTPSSVKFRDSDNNELLIKWANGIEPVFEGGNTYIISIVDNLGVFAQYTNS